MKLIMWIFALCGMKYIEDRTDTEFSPTVYLLLWVALIMALTIDGLYLYRVLSLVIK